ncbi:hypothetical protein TRIP_B200324 [uncultured Desulfatiglans sp.]|uniref:Uncharacterized protein n=1 Tax=Uncultured Desulfatiglans sp. TaxID=1748965 RepID=A0A653A2F2_UNCDX|nr:hypothetical protein TRIP_B200324 [uncultured Desulfatiglans sp.]
MNLILTKDVLYLLSYVGVRPDGRAQRSAGPHLLSALQARGTAPAPDRASLNLERETGFEPATLSLEG